MSYLLLKAIHIFSAFLLFGTGLGSAFYKYLADKSHNIEHIAITNRHVVLADFLFTTPAVIIQLVTGIWMVSLAQLPLSTPWVSISLALYFFAGLCWLPVVYLQIRMQKLSRQALLANTALPPVYWRYVSTWFWLGVPAFSAVSMVIILMVYKHVG